MKGEKSISANGDPDSRENSLKTPLAKHSFLTKLTARDFTGVSNHMSIFPSNNLILKKYQVTLGLLSFPEHLENSKKMFLHK